MFFHFLHLYKTWDFKNATIWDQGAFCFYQVSISIDMTYKKVHHDYQIWLERRVWTTKFVLPLLCQRNKVNKWPVRVSLQITETYEIFLVSWIYLAVISMKTDNLFHWIKKVSELHINKVTQAIHLHVPAVRLNTHNGLKCHMHKEMKIVTTDEDLWGAKNMTTR